MGDGGMKTRLNYALLIVLAVALSCKVASSQVVMPGTPPYSTISGGPVDEINLANLNVHFNIPIFHKPGRGLPFNMDATYDSTIWYPAYSTTFGYYWQNVQTTGWTESSLNVGSLYGDEQTYNGTVYYCDFVYYDGSGTGHPFPGPADPGGSPCPANSSSTGSQVSNAVDGSGYSLTLSNFSGTTFTAQLNSKDGKYIVPPVGTQTGPGHVVDRNGNIISFDGVSTWTDTLGLPTIKWTATSSASTYTYTSPAGAPATVTMALKSYPIQTNFGCPVLDVNGTGNLMDSISLPNGTTYHFTYEATPGGASGTVTGRLASIQLPSGGTISYAFTSINCADGTAGGLVRTTPDGIWTYSRALGSGKAMTTTVTDPLGNQTVIQFQGIYETQRQAYQGSSTSGTLLKTTNTCYNSSASPCTATAITLPITQKSVITQLGPSGPQAKTVYVYSSDASGFLLEQDNYDFGQGAPGSLLKKTIYSQASLGAIKSLAKTITVKDGNNNTISLTTNNFDETSPGLVSSASFSPPVPQHTSITNPRGNLTSVQRWLNTTGGNVTTSTQYYDTGVPYTTTDPNHAGGAATTAYSYSSSFGYAYPTQVTNALGQKTANNYDANTGVQISTTDPNNQVTTFTYDNMTRPTQTSYPDGGQTGICYTDEGGSCTKSGPPFSVVTNTKVTNSFSKVKAIVTDTQGRVSQVQANSDPAGVDYVDTTYDSIGQTHSVSNPHRSSSSPTDGTTTYKYDALSRITEIDEQDGSKITASYTGNCTTVTDEANKTRKSCTDGLGRISSLWEDPSGLNYKTTYTYNVLDNLLSVTQSGSRPRSFVYDSLSRLTQATNPESGTVNYMYDANGNAITKTDGRGITTNYSPSDLPIDALNRVRKKTYSNGDPSVTYTYDGSGCLGQASCYNVGRRTGMVDAAGSEAWSYDKMGRVAVDQRTTNNVTKTTTYSTSSTPYNYDGSIAQLNYPSGRIITYAPNAAGQSVSAVDTANNVNYATLAAYAPHGALSSLLNGANVLSTWYYNNRLQPCRIAVNSSGAAPISCPDSAHTGNVLDLTYGFNSGSSDNGNVSTITNNLTKNTPSTDRSQSFTYDVLNRVATAATVATTGTMCWGEQYGYDAWGNLLLMSGISPTYNGCTQESGLSISVNSNNRIGTSGYSYDNSGNLIGAPPAGTAYTFNAEGEMTQATNSTIIDYVYDGDGKRVEKTSGGAAYKLYWYGMNADPLDESDGHGNITDEYIFFNGKRIARRLGP
jgi:YD repeat-containing protein